MKKLTVLCLILALCLAFASCNASETNSQSADHGHSNGETSQNAYASEIQKQLDATEYFDPCVVVFAVDTSKADALQVITHAYEAVSIKMADVQAVTDCYAERANCYTIDGGNVTLKVASYELLPDVAQALYEHEAVRSVMIERETVHYDLMTEGEKLSYYAAIVHHDVHEKGHAVIVPVEACYSPKATLFVIRQLYTNLRLDETVLETAHANATPVCTEDENGASYVETTDYYVMRYRVDKDGKTVSMSVTLIVDEARLPEVLYRAKAHGAIKFVHLDTKKEFNGDI